MSPFTSSLEPQRPRAVAVRLLPGRATQILASARARCAARVRARYQPQPSRGARLGDAGTLIIEALVAMGVIAVVLAGYVGVNNGVQDATRSNQARDITDQAAQGVLEKARALPYSQLAMLPDDNPPGVVVAPDGTSTYNGAAVVRFADGDVSSTGTLRSVQDATIQGVAVKMSLYIVWLHPGSGDTPPATSNTSPKTFGTKRIWVVATYTPLGSTTTRTVTYQTDRTSYLYEAPPATATAAV